MNKNTFWLITLLFALSFGFVACSDETPEDNPFADWKGSNELYLDSIVKEARSNPADWKIYKNYKIDPAQLEDNLIAPTSLTKHDSVYVKVIKEGNGIIPMSSDTVSVAYQGFLIDGTRFDGNFSGEFDSEINDNYTNMVVGELISGWTTALLYMQEGTYCEMYVPHQMGYKEVGSKNIPGFSVLKFELYLNKVLHPVGPDGRSRKMK